MGLRIRVCRDPSCVLCSILTFFLDHSAVKGTLLTEVLAISFEPVGSEFVCTYETHSCQPIPDCNSKLKIAILPTHMIISKVILTEDYRVHLATTDTVGRPSHWGWFAIHSIANVYAFAQSFSVRPKNRRQLHNAIENANVAQDGLTGAAIDTSFLTLDLTQTFTKPFKNPNILTRDLLLGFSYIATAAFTLIPLAGPLIASAAVALDTVGAVGSMAAGAVSSGAGFWGLALSTG